MAQPARHVAWTHARWTKPFRARGTIERTPFMDSLYSALRPSLPLFDGFPYLNTRVVPALYHIILLPARASETSLADTAGWQVLANRLPVCLVLASNRASFTSRTGVAS